MPLRNVELVHWTGIEGAEGWVGLARGFVRRFRLTSTESMGWSEHLRDLASDDDDDDEDLRWGSFSPTEAAVGAASMAPLPSTDLRSSIVSMPHVCMMRRLRVCERSLANFNRSFMAFAVWTELNN